MTDAAYEKWAAKQRADYQSNHWTRDTERAEFEESIAPNGQRWIWAREAIEEEAKEAAKKLLRRFLAAVPPRAGEIALAAESIGTIAEVDAWHEKTQPQKTGGILVLSGPVGTGKTVAACRVSWMRMVAGGWPYTFIRAAELATMSRYGEEHGKFLNNSHVIVDDLGGEYLDKAGSFLVDLDELVDVFYANRKHLVITTNLDSKGFKARYGVRIEDRIRECGTWITVAGASQRKAP